jgi:hypothetical protein
MNKGKERNAKHKGKDKDKPSEAKPDQKPVGGEQQQHDPWSPAGGPGERSDKDAIGRPVQLDNND